METKVAAGGNRIMKKHRLKIFMERPQSAVC